MGGESMMEEEPPPPPTPEVEPADLVADTLLQSERHCLALSADERIAGVTPEGHAWLLRVVDGGVIRRIADVYSDRPVEEELVAIQDLYSVQPLTATEGILVTQDSVWTLREGPERTRLTAPADYRGEGQVCGDIQDGGLMLDGGRLFEIYEARWWGLTPEVESGEALQFLLKRDGECTGPEGVLWATGQDGSLWRVSGRTFERPVSFTGGVESAAAALGHVSVVDGEGVLWTGLPGEWSSWAAEGGTPSTLGAAGDASWLLLGDSLMRFDGQEFARLDLELAAVTDVYPHAFGVWVSNGEELCHHAVSSVAIRVEGVRPNQRSREQNFRFRARIEAPRPLLVAGMDPPLDPSPLDPAEGNLVATLNDEELALTEEADGWWLLEGSFPAHGWHEVRLRTNTEPIVERTLHLKHEPEERSWDVDIRPVFEAHCSGEECHGAGVTETLDLSTFDAWLDNLDTIGERVVETETMPPPASQSEDWQPALAERIGQWIDGGARP